MGAQAVAVGAAIQAAMLSGELDDLMVMDVWQAALMRAFAKPALEGMVRSPPYMHPCLSGG